MITRCTGGELDNPDLAVELREILGCLPDEPMPNLERLPPEIFEFTSPLGTYFDAFPLHLRTTASLREIASFNRTASFDVRRFRPNILIESEPELSGYAEKRMGWRRTRDRRQPYRSHHSGDALRDDHARTAGGAQGFERPPNHRARQRADPRRVCQHHARRKNRARRCGHPALAQPASGWDHGVFGISGMPPIPGTPEVTPLALGSAGDTPLVTLLAAQEVRMSLAC
jgi:hypothetical protein